MGNNNILYILIIFICTSRNIVYVTRYFNVFRYDKAEAVNETEYSVDMDDAAAEGDGGKGW